MSVLRLSKVLEIFAWMHCSMSIFCLEEEETHFNTSRQRQDSCTENLRRSPKGDPERAKRLSAQTAFPFLPSCFAECYSVSMLPVERVSGPEVVLGPLVLLSPWQWAGGVVVGLFTWINTGGGLADSCLDWVCLDFPSWCFIFAVFVLRSGAITNTGAPRYLEADFMELVCCDVKVSSQSWRGNDCDDPGCGVCGRRLVLGFCSISGFVWFCCAAGREQITGFSN